MINHSLFYDIVRLVMISWMLDIWEKWNQPFSRKVPLKRLTKYLVFPEFLVHHFLDYSMRWMENYQDSLSFEKLISHIHWLSWQKKFNFVMWTVGTLKNMKSGTDY